MKDIHFISFLLFLKGILFDVRNCILHIHLKFNCGRYVIFIANKIAFWSLNPVLGTLLQNLHTHLFLGFTNIYNNPTNAFVWRGGKLVSDAHFSQGIAILCTIKQ